MNVQEQIKAHIESLNEQQSRELQVLHELSLRIAPDAKLWFTDGKNAEGKMVTNPDIGYGQYTIKYADGSTREFYQVGLSATKTGISVYILGLDDKTLLSKNFGERIGKATVTGYCIKFKKLNDINLDVLEETIRFGLHPR